MPKFFTELLVPSSFDHDPYGWVTNQMSHILIGAMVCFWIAAAYYMIVGEWPYKITVAIFTAVGYLGFEIFAHWRGWRGLLDSLADTWFFLIGVSWALLAADEYVKDDGTLGITLNPLGPVLPTIAGVITLSFGVYFRDRK